MEVGEFKVLQDREDNSTMASTWNCYLCLERTKNGLQLCVKGSQVLGLLEDHVQYDDDGDCLYDEKGDYVLPEEINGQKVWGVDDGIIVGENLIDHDGYETLSIGLDKMFDREAMQVWLKEERWDTSIVTEVEKIWKAEQ